MARIEGFGELADELEEIANAFDRIQSRRGTDLSAKNAIEDGVSDAMDDTIVPESKSRARQYVPQEDAETISHERGEWTGDRYQHYFYATSDLVKYHEFGTGMHASDPSKATIEGSTYDGRPGYIISPNGDYPLGIPSSRWNGPTDMVNDETGKVHLSYVIHPGVEAQHFMQNTLEHNSNSIRGHVVSQINELFRENGLM